MLAAWSIAVPAAGLERALQPFERLADLLSRPRDHFRPQAYRNWPPSITNPEIESPDLEMGNIGTIPRQRQPSSWLTRTNPLSGMTGALAGVFTFRFDITVSFYWAAEQKPLTRIEPPSRRKSFVWKGRLLFWGIAAIFGLVSTSWKQIEKFAPGLNKTIHSSVRSQDDVDYRAAKLSEARAQYDKATTKAPGQSLEEYRKQVVTQGQAPLKAMEYEAGNCNRRCLTNI
jgi:hypothetical protein